jgi:hypothetical protein
VNVTFSVTSPYIVEAEPVTDVVPLLLARSLVDDPELLDDPDDELVELSALLAVPVSVPAEAPFAVPVSVDDTAVAAVCDGSCALNPRVPARPATVAARTMGVRFMTPRSRRQVNAPQGNAGSHLSVPARSPPARVSNRT